MVEKGFNQLNSLYGWALHYYANTTGKGNALEYTADEWYELIGRADRIGSLIEQHWTVMGESDPQHRVKLVVDEWGAWHAQDPSLPPGYLFGYPDTLRDYHVFRDVYRAPGRAGGPGVVLVAGGRFQAQPSRAVAGRAQMTPQQRAAMEAVAQSRTGTLWGLQGSASLTESS